METKKFFNELCYTFQVFGRLLRKAFNQKNKTSNLNYNFITFNGTYLSCDRTYH